MNCERALERMLEADPAELASAPDSPLSRHLSGCDRCTAIAEALLAELAGLNDALTRFAELGDDGTVAEAAISASRGSSRSGASGGRAEQDRKSGERRSWRWVRRAALPLAAAAALAVLVLGREPGMPTSPPAVPPAESGAHVTVEPPTDRGAAVMATGNPRITIVWLYQREES